MDRRTRLLPAILIATVVLAAAPATLHAATLSNKSTMFLRTTYLLKAQLNYATGTVSATETITLTNTSGTTISKLNLSVGPVAVYFPLRGISLLSSPGNPYHWPEADAALLASLRQHLRNDSARGQRLGGDRGEHLRA